MDKTDITLLALLVFNTLSAIVFLLIMDKISR